MMYFTVTVIYTLQPAILRNKCPSELGICRPITGSSFEFGFPLLWTLVFLLLSVSKDLNPFYALSFILVHTALLGDALWDYANKEQTLIFILHFGSGQFLGTLRNTCSLLSDSYFLCSRSEEPCEIIKYKIESTILRFPYHLGEELSNSCSF